MTFRDLETTGFYLENFENLDTVKAAIKILTKFNGGKSKHFHDIVTGNETIVRAVRQ